jgi:hypothetical protein
MWAWFSAGGVALAIAIAAGWWMLRSARKKGEQNERDRAIKKAAAVQKDQLDRAAQPPKHRSDILKRMQDGEL